MSRKKTESEKIREGTLRQARNKAPARAVRTGYPEPTAELTAQGLKVYNALCRHLDSREILFEADAALLTATAVTVEKLSEAINDLNVQGTVQVFDNGTRNVSPELSVFEKLTALLMRESRLLGLDPRARQDLLAFLDDGEQAPDDPMRELL